MKVCGSLEKCQKSGEMRWKLRKLLQGIALFVSIVAVNVLLVLLGQGVQQDGRYPGARGQVDWSQNGARQKPVTSNSTNPELLLNPGEVLSDRARRSLENYLTDNLTDDYKDAAKRTKDFNSQGFDHGDKSLAFRHTKHTELSDVFISVKTTKKYHEERIQLLLDTWVVMARDVTYFFTDEDDEILTNKIAKGHLINTNCSARHTRNALCCKMSVEFDMFLASGQRWFCHMDDDTYVNVPRLLKLVQQYNHTQDWYLGKPSLNHPLEMRDVDSPGQQTAFWFGTGGAGFCLSRGLALKMMPYAGGGKLKSMCERVRLPDDCTIGFIVYHYMKQELTVIPGFHSHLEGLWLIQHRDLENHITFSYSQLGQAANVVRVPGFLPSQDPTRFRSIHCHLYPNLPQCQDRGMSQR